IGSEGRTKATECGAANYSDEKKATYHFRSGMNVSRIRNWILTIHYSCIRFGAQATTANHAVRKRKAPGLRCGGRALCVRSKAFIDGYSAWTAAGASQGTA